MVPPLGIDKFSSVQFIQECEQFGGFRTIKVPSSDGTRSYEVTLPPWERTELEIVCECPSYIHRGRCRHQKEALELICYWSELDGMPQTAEQARRRICPGCGGRTQTVVIGVT